MEQYKHVFLACYATYCRAMVHTSLEGSRINEGNTIINMQRTNINLSNLSSSANISLESKTYSSTFKANSSQTYVQIYKYSTGIALKTTRVHTHTHTHTFFLFFSPFSFSLYISSSSSSCRAASTDIPGPLSPLFPNVHRLWQVFLTQLLYVCSSWSSCFSSAICGDP